MKRAYSFREKDEVTFCLSVADLCVLRTLRLLCFSDLCWISFIADKESIESGMDKMCNVLMILMLE
jgi:hypothetical protein